VRFGSVCSGIEAASVAWHPLGWKAAWLSEIEPFPCAVLKHHYPDVPNLGDMTLLPERILSGEVEAPDLFCGGTPCQAFSVAGLRNSLDDARGNLSLTFVGIANAIDHVRSVRGDAPAIIFWENVPGVLSTKDNAFGCFLAALAGESDPVTCPDGKWSTAGVVVGQTRTVAWRVLDAQYFGVAQRRRRVFVIASARNDFDPAEILFEFDSVRRDIAPSREKGEAAARSAGTGASGSSWPAEISSTLDTTFGTKQGLEDQHVNAGCPMFVPVQTFSTPAIGSIREDVLSSCITKNTGGGAETQNPAFVLHPVYELHSQDSRVRELGDVCTTVSATYGSGGGNVPITLAQPIALAENTIGRKPENGGNHDGFTEGGPMYTLNAIGVHGVAQPIAYALDSLASNSMKSANPASGCNVVDVSKALDTSRGLDPSCNQGGMAVAQPIPLDMMNIRGRPSDDGRANRIGRGYGEVGDPMFTITKANHHAVAQPVYSFIQASAQKKATNSVLEELSNTLTATANNNFAGGVSMAVRRLTPIECERLQGFPDNYTDIKLKGKPTPDGPRYKALGNSWAVPVVAWIGKRIAQRLESTSQRKTPDSVNCQG